MGITIINHRQTDEFYDQKLKVFNESIQKQLNDAKQQFEEYKQNMTYIQDNIQLVQVQKEEIQQKKVKKNKEFEKNLKDQILQEAKYRKDQEKKNQDYIEDKNQILIQELDLDKKIKEEKLNHFIEWADNKINSVNFKIMTETAERQKFQEDMINSFGENIINIQLLIDNEKQKQLENNQSIIKRLEQLEQKINTEIQIEKNERDAAEDIILKMIDYTCNRLDSKSNNDI